MRRSALATAALAVVAAVAAGQTLGSQPAPGAAAEGRPKKTEVGKPVVEVPLYLAAGVPVVEAKINGRGPMRLAIDTGRVRSQIDSDVAGVLELRIVVGPPGPGAPDGEPKSVDVASVSLGEAVFSELSLRVVPLRKKMEAERKYVGTLGLGVFSGCVVTLDYPAGRLLIAGGELPAADGDKVLAGRSDAELIVVPASFGKVDVDVAVDTLAKSVFTLKESLWSEIETSANTKAERQIGPRLVSVESAPSFRGDVRLGGHTITGPPVRFHRDEPLVGHDALRNFVVSIDARNRRLRLTRANDEPLSFSPGETKFGLVFLRSGRDLRIHKVLPDSPSTTKPLKEGDFIMELNGRKAADYDDESLRKLLLQKDRIVLKVSRGGLPLLVPLDAE